MTAVSSSPPPVRPAPGRQRALTVAATAAPVALIGGWFVGGAAQPAGYSPVRATISELAATTAQDRWIMTTGFVVTGLCLVVIGGLLSAARPAGRVALVVAGLGVLGVSAAPLPADAAPHTLMAWLTFTALALWPVLGMAPGAAAVGLRRPAATAASAVLVVLILLNGPVGRLGGGGLIERLLAGAEILWVTAVVLGPGGRR